MMRTALKRAQALTSTESRHTGCAARFDNADFVVHYLSRLACDEMHVLLAFTAVDLNQRKA